jgi:hypothetical protein
MRNLTSVRVAVALLLVLVALSGCDLLQKLSVEQAVAHLVPGDPPTIRDPNQLIGDREILMAIEFWVKDESVPRTRGAHIDDSTMRHLIELWAKREFIL